jgi:hypothetical protein
VSTAPTFDAGIPEVRFPLPLAAVIARNRFVVSPDEQRILAVTSAAASTATPTTVVLHWDAALRR